MSTRLAVIMLGLSLACHAGIHAAEQPARTVRVEQSGGLSGISTMFEISESHDGKVTGRFWMTSGRVNRDGVAAEYGCRPRKDSVDPDFWVCMPSAAGVSWPDILARLDRIGIMAPPADDTPKTLICGDGSSWSTEVRRPAPSTSWSDRKGCDPRSEARRRYSAAVDSIISEVDDRYRGRK